MSASSTTTADPNCILEAWQCARDRGFQALLTKSAALIRIAPKTWVSATHFREAAKICRKAMRKTPEQRALIRERTDHARYHERFRALESWNRYLKHADRQR